MLDTNEEKLQRASAIALLRAAQDTGKIRELDSIWDAKMLPIHNGMGTAWLERDTW